MVEGALISKYLSEGDQLKLISDLIKNDDLEQVLELIETGSLDISTDSNIETSIFDKITEQVVAYARVEDDPREMLFSSRTGINDTLRISARLLCNLPSVWERFQIWMCYRLSDIISENSKHLFDDEFGKMTVRPFFDFLAQEQKSRC